MKNLDSMNNFRKIRENGSKLYETVYPFNDGYSVMSSVFVPNSIINAFIKKVKDETGLDARQRMSTDMLAEKLVNYLTTSFLNIENFPTSIVTGDDFQKGTKVQPAAQTQVQTPQGSQEAQTSQGQEGQTSQGQEGQTGQGQEGQAQQTAAQIPSQEGGQEIQGQATQEI